MSASTQNVRAWVERGLITEEQASAISTFESEFAEERSRRGVPILGEIAGYLGGALALAALMTLTMEYWYELGDIGRIFIVAAVSALCLFGAVRLTKVEASQAKRLGQFLFFLATAGFGFTLGLATEFGFDEKWPMLVGATAALVLAVIIWWRLMTPLQLIAVALSLGILVVAVWNFWDNVASAGIGWSYIVLAIAWILATEAGYLKPSTAALVMGCIAALFGAQLVAFDTWDAGLALALLLGAAIGIGLLIAGLIRKRGVMLGFGAAGIVMFMPQLTYELFSDSIGAPISLLLAGMLLVGMSVFLMVVRSRKSGMQPQG